MLLGEDRGGREHCHLLPRLHRLEGRPQRDLGLAVSYVADQQPVHRSGALHVTLHLLGGATLVGSILVQESRFELALPRGVGREREAGRELAAGVQVEQLGRHLANGGAGLVPLTLPRRGAQAVQLGGRGISVPRRAIRLQLIQPVQRDVEPVAPFVFDHRHFERPALRAHRDRLDPAVQPDPVLEVHHIVALLQRAGRGGGGRFAVAPGPPQTACAAEDLVVGQHPERRQHETAVERSHGQRRDLGAEQLLQPLELARVVAQDHRRRTGDDEPPQPFDVAVHGLRRGERKARRLARCIESHTGKCPQIAAPLLGRDEDLRPRGRRFAQPPGDLKVMLRLRPRPIDFLLQRGLLCQHEQRIGREQSEQGVPLLGRSMRPYTGRDPLGAHRQDRDTLDRLPRALGVQIERAQRHDVIAGPLDPSRRRHPEPVHIEDAAAHAELGDLGHRGDAIVRHRSEPPHDLREAPGAYLQHEPHRLERRRHRRPLRRSARRRDEHADPAR